MFDKIAQSLNNVGQPLANLFDEKSRNLVKSQWELLKDILSVNQTCEFGRRHNFSSIQSVQDFQNGLPIQNHDAISHEINRCEEGLKNVLTTEEITMFTVTSGTTNKPKRIPVTESSKKKTADLMTQWFYRILQKHPHFLKGKSFMVVSSMNESETSGKIPCGSMSGLIYQVLPEFMRDSFVLPFYLSDIQNYDLRYYLMMRLGFQQNVSFVATPNPMTLIKLAETGIQFQRAIIAAIEEGSAFIKNLFTPSEHDLRIIKQLERQLKPDPSRAAFLRCKISEYTQLLPKHFWENLTVIGCWLGGTIGYQAQRLKAYYGDIVLKDLGYMASEGMITIPIEDNSKKGVLAIENNFYEFIPIDCNSATPLLSHQLKIGMLYKILLTNYSGLYRYDLNDTIKVESFYNQTPVISFVRKTENVLNITGEKVHVNQLIYAIEHTQKELDHHWRQVRIVSNLENNRYEMMLSLEGSASQHFIREKLIPTFDSFLAKCNIEYQQKRNSHRLKMPCVHLMHPDWEASVQKEDIRNGKRDIQYKWEIAVNKITDMDKKFILKTISNEDDL